MSTPKSKQTMQAESLSRALTFIGPAMEGWEKDGYDINMLPSFYPAKPIHSKNNGAYVIDRSAFTNEYWAGTEKYIADAKAAMSSRPNVKAKEQTYLALCDAEREAVATSYVLEIFGITNQEKGLRDLRKVSDMALFTVGEDHKAQILAALKPWAARHD